MRRDRPKSIPVYARINPLDHQDLVDKSPVKMATPLRDIVPRGTIQGRALSRRDGRRRGREDQHPLGRRVVQIRPGDSDLLQLAQGVRVVIRIASVDPPRPIVVRVDEIGRAEAVAYDVMEAQADPLDPTTKYFLNRFVYDFYSRRRATVEENWSRSLRFLTTDLANASFRAESQNIALLAAGAARDELQVDRVVLRIQANPQEPHSASADFDLVRLVAEGEVDRERWSLSLQFLFLDEIPPDLIVHNPMGIVITYLQGDRAVVTGRTMIEHLKGRERALAALGWTGREAEWIALVCLHSGVFTRAQFCHYFEAHRSAARRIVRTLLERREAVEGEWPLVNGGGKTCRISSKGIYRALGVENIRHRRKANRSVVMRRLLSLDFVLEHPGMNWLPTEAEKVEFLEGLGVHSNLIPRRIYYGAVRAQKRYFALKLPVAGGADTVTFAYVDPGRDTTGELNTWGGAHGRLWDAIRAKGRRVEVIAIGAELGAVFAGGSGATALGGGGAGEGDRGVDGEAGD